MPKLSERDKNVHAALAQINKTFGAGTVFQLGKSKLPNIDAIPTGIPSLDKLTGIGGVPRGRLTEIFGKPGGGKSTLSLHAVAQCQLLGGVAAWIDAEQSFDPKWARTIGVDISKLIISQPDYGEQGLQIAETLILSGAIEIIVVDSVAMLVPKAVVEGEIGDASVAVHARMMTQALGKLTVQVRKSYCAFVCINQVRSKFGSYNEGTKTTGGWALEHNASLRLSVDRIQSLKKGDKVIGHRSRVRVPKNKCGGDPFQEIEMDLVYGEGFSKEADLVDMASQLGILEKQGTWYSYEGERIGQGREETRLFLKDNPETTNRILSTVMQATKSSHGEQIDGETPVRP